MKFDRQCQYDLLTAMPRGRVTTYGWLVQQLEKTNRKENTLCRLFGAALG